MRKRNTLGLEACSKYAERLCPDDKPCEYHQAMSEAKQRGISTAAYIKWKRENERNETR